MTVRQPAQNVTGLVAAKRDLLELARAEYRAGRGGYDEVVYAEVQLAAAEQERVSGRERREKR
ncbi:MAG TPA: hypothetical protein VN894_16210 [Polyangiaceae bacterium]|nr:hypothetical protein [Polyangiaceae bacterium]